VSGFCADWLALRAGADARARDRGLAARLAAHLAGKPALRVLDLGAGTGANMRATAPLIPAPQHWLLVDNDAALLARAEAPPGVGPGIGPAVGPGVGPGVEIERREADLAAELGGLFDPAPDLVTASAFLDLCGADWLDRLAAAVVAADAALYAVLSYDGRESWSPPDPLDARVLAAFHADQRHDKGLGPALGPAAHAHLAERLRDAGCRVFEAPSDWRLAAPGDAALIAALATGSAAAVRPALGPAAEIWRDARIAARAVTIGHRDLLALPPG